MKETESVEKHLSAPRAAGQKKVWITPAATVEQVRTATKNGFVNRPGGDGVTVSCHS